MSVITLALTIVVAIAAVVIAIASKEIWSSLTGDIAIINALQDKITAPNLDQHVAEILSAFANVSTPDNPKLLYLVHSRNLALSENLLCNLGTVSSSKVRQDHIFVALDKVSQGRMRDLWEYPQNVMYLPYDELMNDAAPEFDGNFDITWAIRMRLAGLIAERYDKMFCFSTIDTIWLRDFAGVLHFQKTRPNWDIMTDTVGYWGPLTALPDLGTLCFRPSAHVRKFWTHLSTSVFHNGTSQQLTFKRLCDNQFANVSCAPFRKNHISTSAYYLLRPVERRKVTSVAVRYSVWPFQNRIPPEQETLNWLEQMNMTFTKVNEQGQKVCNTALVRAIRQNEAALWGQPVRVEHWMSYLIHSWIQYGLKYFPI